MRWIAAATFLVLSALGWHVLIGHTRISGGVRLLTAGTKSGRTGYKKIDRYFDLLIHFSQYGLLPVGTVRPHYLSLLVTSSVCLAAMELEAVRAGASVLTKCSVVWGIGYAIFGGGIFIPLYYAFLLNTGPAPYSRGSAISPTGAQSAVFAIVFGMFPPVVGMFQVGGVMEITLYQFMPVYIWVLRVGYGYAVGIESSSTSRSIIRNDDDDIMGYNQVLVVYLILGIISIYVNYKHILLPALMKRSSPLTTYLYELYVPSLSEPSAAATTAYSAVTHFLKWDMIMIVGSSFLAGIWDMDVVEQVTMCVWFVVASLVMSPGAALAGVWAYRERSIRAGRVRSRE